MNEKGDSKKWLHITVKSQHYIVDYRLMTERMVSRIQLQIKENC